MSGTNGVETNGMPTPCEQKETIGEIWDAVDELKSSTIRVETSVTAMVEEFRDLSKVLRESLLDGRGLRERVDTVARDVNIAFTEIRTISENLQKAIGSNRDSLDKVRKEEIEPLKTWQNRVDGSLMVFKGVQIIIGIAVGILSIVAVVR